MQGFTHEVCVLSEVPAAIACAINALGNVDTLLTPSLPRSRATGTARQAACQSLFRHHQDAEAIGDIRMAISQNQPLGNERFYARIERITGQRCEAKPRGSPRLEAPDKDTPLPGQGELGL